MAMQTKVDKAALPQPMPLTTPSLPLPPCSQAKVSPREDVVTVDEDPFGQSSNSESSWGIICQHCLFSFCFCTIIGKMASNDKLDKTLQELIDILLLQLMEPNKRTVPQFLLMFRNKYLDLLQLIFQRKLKLSESSGSYPDMYKYNELVSVLYVTLDKLSSNFSALVYQEIFLILSSLKSCPIAL